MKNYSFIHSLEAIRTLKFILLLLLTFTLMVVTADQSLSSPKVDSIEVSNDPTTGQQVLSASKEAISTLYSDVKTVVESIADGLKVGAEHVYAVLIKQQLVFAITWTIISSLVFICGVIILLFSFKTENENDQDVAMLFLAAYIIILLFTGNDIIIGYMNPEYGAIREILEHVKDLK